MTLEVRNVSINRGERRVLEEVSFRVESGQMLGLFGASGAGKSTLLGVLCGQLKASSGTITVDGKRCTSAGFVPQAPFERRAALSVREVVALSRPRSGLITSRTERLRSESTLERLGMAPYANRRLSELSGGQLQRVAIATAVNLGSSVLLCDEPTSGADPVVAQDVLTLLRELVDDGNSVIVASHDVERLLPRIDRVVGLRVGRVVLDADAGEVTTTDTERLFSRLEVSG
jgi:ABC-type Mn2+/Zn2+ transport system ATPase subunit